MGSQKAMGAEFKPEAENKTLRRINHADDMGAHRLQCLADVVGDVHILKREGGYGNITR